MINLRCTACPEGADLESSHASVPLAKVVRLDNGRRGGGGGSGSGSGGSSGSSGGTKRTREQTALGDHLHSGPRYYQPGGSKFRGALLEAEMPPTEPRSDNPRVRNYDPTEVKDAGVSEDLYSELRGQLLKVNWSLAKEKKPGHGKYILLGMTAGKSGRPADVSADSSRYPELYKLLYEAFEPAVRNEKWSTFQINQDFRVGAEHYHMHPNNTGHAYITTVFTDDEATGGEFYCGKGQTNGKAMDARHKILRFDGARGMHGCKSAVSSGTRFSVVAFHCPLWSNSAMGKLGHPPRPPTPKNQGVSDDSSSDDSAIDSGGGGGGGGGGSQRSKSHAAPPHPPLSFTAWEAEQLKQEDAGSVLHELGSAALLAAAGTETEELAWAASAKAVQEKLLELKLTGLRTAEGEVEAPLLVAAYNSFTTLARALLAAVHEECPTDIADKFKGAVCNDCEDPSKFNALHQACIAPCATSDEQMRQADLVRFMLKVVPDAVQWKAADGELPLHVACMSPNVEIVKVLLEFDSPDTSSGNGWTIFHWCVDPQSDVNAPADVTSEAAQKAMVEVIDVLVAHVHKSQPAELTRLINLGDEGEAETALVNPSTQSPPLVWAVWHGRWLIADALIKRGADIDAVNSMGNTALHYAAYLSDSHKCSTAASVEHRGMACRCRAFGTMSGSGKQEPYCGSVDNTGGGSLEHMRCLKVLLHSAADISVKNHNGQQPVDVAPDCAARQLLEKAALENAGRGGGGGGAGCSGGGEQQGGGQHQAGTVAGKGKRKRASESNVVMADISGGLENFAVPVINEMDADQNAVEPSFQYAAEPFESEAVAGRALPSGWALKHSFEIFRKPHHVGWGVRTLAPLSKGTRLFQYVGEHVRGDVASNCTNDEYLMQVIRSEVAVGDGSGKCSIQLDNKRRGNLARFVNHSCSPSM
jgi:hypothetical protein